jgi:uncharacterized membrane protein YGL010W
MLLWSAFLTLGLYTRQRMLPLMAVTMYSLYFIYLTPVVGTVATIFYFAIWKHVDYLIMTKRRSTCWKLALLGQVLGWGLQVALGHAYYEGRKPALLDSLVQFVYLLCSLSIKLTDR